MHQRISLWRLDVAGMLHAWRKPLADLAGIIFFHTLLS